MNLHDGGTDPAAIIAALGLQPHPEGGHYREIWRDTPVDRSRGAGTAIYYLLTEGQRSHWHRIDAAEAWHFYGGAPLRLQVTADGKTTSAITLGPDLAVGHHPFALVPCGHWQAAESLGNWTLVGCTVSPAFLFSGFELAPPDWQPHT
jgi:predicted cupin superfamily sugar epimerase